MTHEFSNNSRGLKSDGTQGYFARLGLPNEISVEVSAADHTTICKFNHKDSTRYRPVWMAFQKPAKRLKKT